MTTDPIPGARFRNCRHFRGLDAPDCRAGVRYRELAGGGGLGLGWATRLPCIAEWRTQPERQTARCEKFDAAADEGED
jgi:hypothetical protein